MQFRSAAETNNFPQTFLPLSLPILGTFAILAVGFWEEILWRVENKCFLSPSAIALSFPPMLFSFPADFHSRRILARKTRVDRRLPPVVSLADK